MCQNVTSDAVYLEYIWAVPYIILKRGRGAANSFFNPSTARATFIPKAHPPDTVGPSVNTKSIAGGLFPRTNAPPPSGHVFPTTPPSHEPNKSCPLRPLRIIYGAVLRVRVLSRKGCSGRGRYFYQDQIWEYM